MQKRDRIPDVCGRGKKLSVRINIAALQNKGKRDKAQEGIDRAYQCSKYASSKVLPWRVGKTNLH
jgi:hypothetical protein